MSPGATDFDRRDFLKAGAVAGGGLLLGLWLPGAGRAEATVAALADPALAGFQPSAWVRVDPDGSVTIWCGKVDMGQGVRTALPMIVADELDVPWESVTVVQADAHPDRWGRQMTVGSGSVRRGAWMDLRRAGAAARQMLVSAAGAALGVSVAELSTDGTGRVVHETSGSSRTYGELADAAAALEVPSEPRLKDPADFRYIGRGVPLRDLEEKVTGAARYGADVRVPGMLYATVVKPRVLGGSVESFDAQAARAVDGVRDVVEISSGIAVVADHTWAAFEGAKALSPGWSGDFRMSSADISAHHAALLEDDAVEARRDGDAPGELRWAGGEVVEATYEVPYLAHATMEPMNCTADVRADGAEVWAPTQNPQGAQSTTARIAGLDVSRVTVHPTWMGCGWGRRGGTDYVDDAVETSLAVGAPVQMVWTREEDTRNDPYRPASTIRFRGAADASGIRALHARVAGPPLGVTSGRTGSGVDRNAVDGVVTLTYRIPHFLAEYCRSNVQVPTGYWRSVGPSGNCFMVEGFVDELAAAAGADPLAFRLAMLDEHPRMKHVLEAAASMAEWDAGPPAGRGRGVGIVEDKGGIVAQIAEVSVDGGRVRVHRVWLAADCGRIVHPGIVHQQMVGSVVAGLTAALYGEITLEDGRVVQSNFHDYRMLRMREMPTVDVRLVDSAEEPGGVGEPAVPPIAPAVANAVFALTGQRVRKLPIRLG
ncbi:MAG: molybdopterin-dependent oxidoreductase [Gemmatimonadota bacterium]|jgi:CO/xanthine dehydrogenase Mo-binding subunit